MRTIGTYTVTGDARSLEGWTVETLAEALRGPLGEIGIEVETAPTTFGGPGLVLADEDPLLRERIQQIVEETVTG